MPIFNYKKIYYNGGKSSKLALSFFTYFAHNFKKSSKSAIPKHFFIATFVSFHNAVGNLNVY